MRTLSLQAPHISGIDVAAWQRFLVTQNVGVNISCIYGQDSNQGTKAYQTAQGLTSDGVVGPKTYATAVRNGFQPPAGQLAIPGIDASDSCEALAAGIAGLGMKFVIRYYSQQFNWKVMARPEAAALSAANLQIVVVYQDTSNDIEYFTTQLGSANAAAALESASAIGQPAGSAIYFAADFDPNPGQVSGPLSDYFNAVCQAFAVAPIQYAVGVYGSGLTCRLIRDSGLATFTWLSGSTGFRESPTFQPQAHLLQILPERPIFGLSTDDNVAQSANFGAFQIIG